jgi:hypothetical protein
VLLNDPIYGYKLELPEEEKVNISEDLLEKINILTKPQIERTNENINKLLKHFSNLDFFRRASIS